MNNHVSLTKFQLDPTVNEVEISFFPRKRKLEKQGGTLRGKSGAQHPVPSIHLLMASRGPKVVSDDTKSGA